MNYNQWISLYFERSNALQWYWTLYVVIVGGLLAFSSLRQRGDLLTTLIISVLFCFFGYKNLGAILDTSLQRQAALDAIKTVSINSAEADQIDMRRKLEGTLVAADPPGTRNFHITSDVLTVACLWAMELRRRRMQTVEATKA
jgi:hypothetical protein